MKECPKCERIFEYNTEQSIAIDKKGKCICCIIEAGEQIVMEPYEFEVKEKEGKG